MSLIIKSNEVNTIVYKYLLQSGLSHTAFTMFNQAKLQQSLKQFKFDIKSGHLLSLLQKSLVFSQIQAHINFSEYMQCKQPFFLLKSHTCQITQKIKEEKQKLMKQLNEQIVQSMKRTNAIYNTELSNSLYDDIIYQSRGANYFQKFDKFRYAEKDDQYKDKLIQIKGSDNKFALYSGEQNAIFILQNQLSSRDVNLLRIEPCIYEGNISEIKTFGLTPQYLVVVYPENHIKLLSFNQDQWATQTLKLNMAGQVKSIQVNQNIPFLICFCTHQNYQVFNTRNTKVILKGNGKLKFRMFDEIVLLQNNQLELKSLLNLNTIIRFNTNNLNVEEISFSKNKTFMSASSLTEAKVNVYTFQKQQPLYIFNFQQQQQTLKQTLWINRKQVDYLVLLTDQAVRVWEVEFNAYCLKIQIKKYDQNISKMCFLEKDDGEIYLVCLGKTNIIVSDIANQKIQRIQNPGLIKAMNNLGNTKISIINQSAIYFIIAEQLDYLFK